MSDTEIRAMRYTIEQLSEKLHATEQYLRDVKKSLDIAVDALKRIADAPIGYCMFAEEALEQIKDNDKDVK